MSNTIISEHTFATIEVPKAPTVKDIYGGPMTVPEGYEYVAFRVANQEGDLYINPVDQSDILTGHYSYKLPRIIVRALPIPTVESVYSKSLQDLKIPKGYEAGDFKKPGPADTWLNTCGCDVENCDYVVQFGEYSSPRLILTQVPTVESIYGAPQARLTPPEGWTFGVFKRLESSDKDFLGAFSAHPEPLGKCENWGHDNGKWRLTLVKAKPLPVQVSGWETVKVAVADIYGGVVTLPVGYAFKRFAVPALGESFVGIVNQDRVFVEHGKDNGSPRGPRIIVERNIAE